MIVRSLLPNERNAPLCYGSVHLLKNILFPAFPNPFWIFGSQLGYPLGFEELGNANNIQLGKIISEFLFSLARIWNTQFYYIIQVHCSALKVAICPPVFQTTVWLHRSLSLPALLPSLRFWPLYWGQLFHWSAWGSPAALCFPPSSESFALLSSPTGLSNPAGSTALSFFVIYVL